MKLHLMIDNIINPLECFFDSEGHAALDRNSGPGHKKYPSDTIDSRRSLYCLSP